MGNNMPMIQGIDGGALINMFRAGREDRYNHDVGQLKMAQAQRGMAREDKVNGLVGQLFAPQGGVSGNYAPSQPQPTFDQAFGGDTQAALDTPGAALPALPAQAPAQAAPGRPQVNQDVLRQLIILDPETGGKMAEAFGKMSDTEIKQHRFKNDAMGSGATYLERLPMNERQQAFQHIVAPSLIDAGWTQQEIAGVDLSDHGLIGYQAVARDTDKIIDQTLARDKFNAGDTVPMVPGGGVASVRPTYDEQGNVTGNSASTVIQPYQAANSAPTAALPHVSTPEEAHKLPPGSQFIMPDGRIGTVPGGAGGNASGGFQSGG